MQPVQLPEHRIETRRVADLVPADYNPRRISPKAMEGLKKSLAEFGAVQPIVVNERTGHIVGGHQRVKALAALGQVETTVIVVDLSMTREKALNVALNNPHISGEFDDGLGDLLDEINGEMPELFADLRLDELLAPVDEPKEGLTDPDDVPEPMPDPVARAGDVWVMGAHRIICGDCRNAEDMATLLGGDRINVAVTSPPYASQRKYDEASGFKPIPPDEYVEWFCAVQQNVRSSLAEDGSWFVNIKEHCEDGQRHLYVKDLAIAHVRQWGWRFIDELVWTHGGTPGEAHRRFKNGWEPVFQFAACHEFKFRPDAVMHESKSVPGKYSESKRGRIGAAESQGKTGDIFANGAKREGMAYPSNVLKLGKNAEALGHSAAFPVDLPLFFIKAYSDSGDIVFDPFMGSGTTLIACEQAGRQARGTEISPAYCDLVVTRWQTFTGKQATLDGDGRTFAEIAAERATA